MGCLSPQIPSVHVILTPAPISDVYHCIRPWCKEQDNGRSLETDQAEEPLDTGFCEKDMSFLRVGGASLRLCSSVLRNSTIMVS